MMIKPDEGYIKFNLVWNEKAFDFKDDDFNAINSIRKQLFDLGFIGVYPDGIGFGNLSIRQQNNEFVISGSATGSITDLEKKHYALVKDFSIQNNQVWCEGLSKASSESMSHAAIYQSNKNVGAVLHVHHVKLWEQLLHVLPSTPPKAEFGTPEMAIEIARLSKSNSGIIMMAGHPEGIITYGKNLQEAYDLLLKQYNNL
jgi:ribulose-5-phosphate 4-epimerase/fuculose-1-phosphate aldolase